MGAVVDERLRVHGINGLRVIDASVMPEIPRAMVNAATIVVAERASDLVLAVSVAREVHSPRSGPSRNHPSQPVGGLPTKGRVRPKADMRILPTAHFGSCSNGHRGAIKDQGTNRNLSERLLGQGKSLRKSGIPGEAKWIFVQDQILSILFSERRAASEKYMKDYARGPTEDS
jgi:hypothetical protein